jgi:putative endonuclease
MLGSRSMSRLSKYYTVYITASKKNGTLYVGLTNNLKRRIYEHKEGLIDGFTKEHKVVMLVYYEVFYSINDAIAREKQLKWWQRKWKLNLIEKDNFDWKDLYGEL